MLKAFDCVDHNQLWKILKEMGIPDHLTCLLRNLYAGQEATVRTEHGTTDYFQIRKQVHQGCILSPCLLTSMQSTSWETLAGGSTSWNQDYWEKYQQPHINKWHHPLAESKELKSLLIKVKEKSKKVGLKLNIQKSKIMTSIPITSWQIDQETMETVTDFIFLGSKITADSDCSHEIKTLAPWKKSYDKPWQHIKKQRHYFADKGPSSQAMVFPVIMYGLRVGP